MKTNNEDTFYVSIPDFRCPKCLKTHNLLYSRSRTVRCCGRSYVHESKRRAKMEKIDKQQANIKRRQR
jgi:hypothetical protein